MTLFYPNYDVVKKEKVPITVSDPVIVLEAEP